MCLQLLLSYYYLRHNLFTIQVILFILQHIDFLNIINFCIQNPPQTIWVWYNGKYIIIPISWTK